MKFVFIFLSVFYCAVNIVGCTKNSECSHRFPRLLDVETPEMGKSGAFVIAKVKFWAENSDDLINSAKSPIKNSEMEFQYSVISCNGIKFPHIKDQEVKFRIQEPGTYTLIFLSTDGEDIHREILIE